MFTVMQRTTIAVVALTLGLSASASAQHRGRVVVVPRGGFHAPIFYEPYWGPYYGYGYPYYYGYYGRPAADVRVDVTPKQAQVYVDGFFAGEARDFNGAFKRLHTLPGGHAITLYLDGYRTVTENVYVRPDSTFTMRDTMQKLGAGEVSAPPPPPASQSGPPADPPTDR
jgi:PEGA domain